jgi:hypothetical protein
MRDAICNRSCNAPVRVPSRTTSWPPPWLATPTPDPATPYETYGTPSQPIPWSELRTWRWGAAIGDPTPGIVISRPLTPTEGLR